MMILQRRMWAIIDYLKANHPKFYKGVKTILKPFLKRLVMWVLTFKKLQSINQEDVDSLNDRVKISFIIFNPSGLISISKILNVLIFNRKKFSEIIIVSKLPHKIKGVLFSKIRYENTIANAILHANGNYLCFIDKNEYFSRLGLNYLHKVITKTKKDLYIGNYIDKTGEIISVHNSELNFDFSEAVLPTTSAFGLKVISREAAVKVRLPRTSVYSYFLEATDKISNVEYIEYPIVHNNNKKSDLEIDKNNYIKDQEDTLRRRFIYSKKEAAKSVNKILFIAPWLVVGGAEKVLLDLSNELIKKGKRVDVFCTHGGGEWEKEFKKIGVKIYISKKQSAGDKITEIHNIVKKEQYDLIHTSNTEYGYFYSAKAKELSYRPIFIDTIHSQNNPLVKIAEVYQPYIDKIVTVNNFIKEVMSGEIVKNKMVPVLNGVDTSKYKARKISLRHKEVEITFLGRLSEEKNPMQFITIAKKLADKHDYWKFKVIGDGPMYKNMQLLAEDLGLKNRINFVGQVAKGAEELTSSSCCVITSHTEGLPIVLLESLSLGIPVVSSNVGGISEVLFDNKNGYLIDGADNTNEYVKKIEKLFSSEDRYRTISEAAIVSVKEYTSSKNADNIMSVYFEAIKGIEEKFKKLTTIAMLSFNRVDAIARTLDTIYKNTDVPFNVFVLDNGSNDETKDFIVNFASSHGNFKYTFEEKNLGCPGGRHKMLKMIESDYIVTIDNDMEVPKYWLRDLIIRIEEDKRIMGVCVKDVFPWGKVEFTGGNISKDENGFYLFNAVNYNKSYDDLSTLEEIDCDWLPGGATLWQGNVLNVAEHSLEYINAFEDYDYALQIVKKGYRIVNCPSVMFIHHHASGWDKKQKTKEAKYIIDRNNENGFIISLAAFFRRTGYIMRNDKIYDLLNISNEASPKEVKKLIENYAAALKRP